MTQREESVLVPVARVLIALGLPPTTVAHVAVDGFELGDLVSNFDQVPAAKRAHIGVGVRQWGG